MPESIFERRLKKIKIKKEGTVSFRLYNHFTFVPLEYRPLQLVEIQNLLFTQRSVQWENSKFAKEFG